MAAGPASYGLTDSMGRMHGDAQFAGSSSVPAHVEMMGLIGMGNNPMVGEPGGLSIFMAQPSGCAILFCQNGFKKKKSMNIIPFWEKNRMNQRASCAIIAGRIARFPTDLTDFVPWPGVFHGKVSANKEVNRHL